MCILPYSVHVYCTCTYIYMYISSTVHDWAQMRHASPFAFSINIQCTCVYYYSVTDFECSCTIQFVVHMYIRTRTCVVCHIVLTKRGEQYVLPSYRQSSIQLISFLPLSPCFRLWSSSYVRVVSLLDTGCSTRQWVWSQGRLAFWPIFTIPTLFRWEGDRELMGPSGDQLWYIHVTPCNCCHSWYPVLCCVELCCIASVPHWTTLDKTYVYSNGLSSVTCTHVCTCTSTCTCVQCTCSTLKYIYLFYYLCLFIFLVFKKTFLLQHVGLSS